MSDFLLVYDGFDPAREGLREALTSTGNGYSCTRGCAEWEDADSTHYPGTYAHEHYNRRTTVMGIHPVPFRGDPIRVTIDGTEPSVEALADGFSGAVGVGVGDEVHALSAGERRTFSIAAPAAFRIAGTT